MAIWDEPAKPSLRVGGWVAATKADLTSGHSLWCNWHLMNDDYMMQLALMSDFCFIIPDFVD
jgi:hypothetical protein